MTFICIILKKMMENKKRLYVIIDKALEPVYGCVQGGHAVAQWLLEHPDQKWNNAYLIYLKANIFETKRRLVRRGEDFSEFKEPDLGNKLTAIALESDGRMFKNLKLVA